jgi:4-amino-4-deoxy-L-arabinose transferase-like glycosyltransferase
VLLGALVVSGIALCCRLAWLASPSSNTGDSVEYVETGLRLAATGMFSMDGVVASSWLPPLYPALIAISSLVSADPVALLLAVQAVLGAITVGLVYSIADRFFGRRAAIIAALGLALAPMTSRYAAVLLTESIFTFLLIAGTWAWGRQHAVICGFAFGLAVLARTSLLPYVLLLGIAGTLPIVHGNRQVYRRIAIVALLTVAPWVIRNVIEVGRVTVADASWGNNLLLGTVPLYPGANRYAAIRAEVGESPDTPSVTLEAASARLAVSRIRGDPPRWIRARLSQYPFLFVDTGDYLPLQANRTGFLRAWSERAWSTLILKTTFLCGNLVLLVLAAKGMWRSRHRASEIVPLWSVPAYYAAAHVPMFVEPRYGLPLVPFLLIFAGAALSPDC